MTEITNESTSEVVVKGTCVTTIEGYIATLNGILDEAALYDTNKFKAKAELNKCSTGIRTQINATRKSMGEFNKAVNEDCKIKRESFDGTPEEQIKKQEDRIKKMHDAFTKAKKKLEADKAAL